MLDGGGEIFGDIEISEQIQISPPNIWVRFCKSPSGSCASCGRHICRRCKVLAHMHYHMPRLAPAAILAWFCIPIVLLYLVLQLCVAMTKQLCSNLGGTALSKANFVTAPQKWPKNDQYFVVETFHGIINPSEMYMFRVIIITDLQVEKTVACFW